VGTPIGSPLAQKRPVLCSVKSNQTKTKNMKKQTVITLTEEAEVTTLEIQTSENEKMSFYNLKGLKQTFVDSICSALETNASKRHIEKIKENL
jgi:hypothetical protein